MNRLAVIILAGLVALGATGSVALTASHEAPANLAYAAWHEPEPAPVAPVSTPAPVASPSVARCQEDEPCWDCATMGNRICGPAIVPAPVVTPVTPRKPVPTVTVTGVTVQPHTTPVAVPTASPAPATVPTVKPTPTATPSAKPTCPPMVHDARGVNMTPPDAPKECVYAQ